jgi:glycosyltransferase involved in cell wall biosynthesis
MKAVIVHRSFDVLGGAELYALNVIRVLTSLDYDARVYTLSIRSSVYKMTPPGRVGFVLVRPLLRTGSVYDLILDAHSLSRALKLVRSDVDIVVNTKASEVPLEADVCVVHYPLGFALHFWERVPLGAGVDPKYVNSLFWKLYIQPFRELFYELSNRSLRRCRVIVANSRWTAKLLEELSGLSSVVIYPPIDLEYLKPPVRVSKENVVVTISRFEPSKNIEAVLHVAKGVQHAKFVVIGRVSDRASYTYYKSLEKLKERLGLSNLYLLPNLGEDAKRFILSRAKVYFHPTIGEHFGISVLEALALGATPVVSVFSGSCTDIVESVGYGYCYNSYAEALEIIKDLVSRRELEVPDAERLSGMLSTFSFEEFSRRFTEVIKSH